MDSDSVNLRARIEALEAELGRLKSSVAPCSPATNQSTATQLPGQPFDEPGASRREWLKYGAVALGAAAAGVTATTAEAADGDPLVVGDDASFTRRTSLQGSASTGFFVNLRGLPNFLPSYAMIARLSGPGHAVLAEVYDQESLKATTASAAVFGINYGQTVGSGGVGGFGVYGVSSKGHGVVGAATFERTAAVIGTTNGVSGSYAGVFYGPTVIVGDFTVVDGAKSAAVRHPDGSHRRLYCVESPESWFEDFGEATLDCGEVRVNLDPDFMAVADTAKYHVFLSGYDGLSDLSVCHRTSAGFTVRAVSGSGSAGSFSWRVVAKRKDIAGARLERVEIPKAPTLPDMPGPAHKGIHEDSRRRR